MIEIQVLTALFQILILVLLFFFLRRFAFRPLMKVLNDRQNYIEKQVSDAENSRIEAAALIQKHQEQIAQSKRDASELLETARRTGEQQAVSIVEAAREEAKRIKEEAISDITREKELAVSELREQIGFLSVSLAEKILAREVNASVHAGLLDQAVRELGEQLC